MKTLFAVIVAFLATTTMAGGADLPSCQHQSPGRVPSYGSAAQKAGFHQGVHKNCQPEERK